MGRLHIVTIDTDSPVRNAECGVVTMSCAVRIFGLRVCVIYVCRLEDGRTVFALERQLDMLP